MENTPETIQAVSKLTSKEERLLEVLVKAETSKLNVIQICEEAKVDTSTYYRAFKKDYFVARIHDECVGLVHSSVLPVLHHARAAAILGEKNSHHWGRILLEMSGLYIPKKEAQVKAEIKLIFEVPRPGMDESKIIEINPKKD